VFEALSNHSLLATFASGATLAIENALLYANLEREKTEKEDWQ
jgi:hypothetical protein